MKLGVSGLESAVLSHLIDSQCIVVAFTSFDRGGNSQPFDFASLVGQTDISCVLVRDIRDTWFHGPTITSDWGVAPLRDYLKKVTASYNRVICIGSSMGAYAAMLFGGLIEADQVLAFAPQTLLDPVETMAIGDARFKSHFEVISAKTPDQDLMALPTQSMAPTELFVGSSDLLDLAHAEWVAADPNVRVHVLDGLGHNLVEALKAMGILRRLLAASSRSSSLPDVVGEVRSIVAERRHAVFIRSADTQAQAQTIDVTVESLAALDRIELHYLVARRNTHQVAYQGRAMRQGAGLFRVSLPVHALAGNYDARFQLIERGLLHDRLGIAPVEIKFTVEPRAALSFVAYPGRVSQDLQDQDRWSFPISGGKLQVNPALVSGDVITTPSTGCVAYGPYVDLPSGRYEASMIFDSACEGSAEIDVFSLPNHVHARAGVSGKQTRVLFNLAEPTEQVEVRLFASEGFRATLQGLEIIRVQRTRASRAQPSPGPGATVETWAQRFRYREANSTVIARGDAPDVVFIGDSITEQWEMLTPAFFRNGRINRGIGGQTTPQILARFDQDVIELRPRAVHIMAGINDIAGNSGPMLEAQTQENLGEMIRRARRSGISVIVAPILPSTKIVWSPTVEPAGAILRINRWLRAEAIINDLVWADYTAVLDNGCGDIRAPYTMDGVHLNQSGYDLIEPIADAAIDEALRRSENPE